MAMDVIGFSFQRKVYYIILYLYSSQFLWFVLNFIYFTPNQCPTLYQVEIEGIH